MHKVTLGNTGLEVHRMGIGGIPIQRVGQDIAQQVVNTALELGVNFLDTARGYTDSEEKFGKAMQGVRHCFVLATKSPARDAAGIRADIETSLRNMQTDYIDIYQLHNVSTVADLERVLSPGGALEALQSAKQQGLVRHIGISSHSADILMQAVQTSCFATVQAPVNAVERQFIPVLQAAKERGIATIAMKPLAGGSFRHPELALRSLLAEATVDVLIPGIDSVEQLRHNAGLVGLPALTAEQEDILVQEVLELGKGFCRRCEYCLPCPQGIRIPVVFILEGYVSRYNMPDWARGRYRDLPAYADRCSECGLCEERCPYKLSIRDMLKRAHLALRTE